MIRSIIKAGALLSSVLLRNWIGAMDRKFACEGDNIDPFSPLGKKRIFLFWHEHLLLPLTIWQHCNISMLLSQHRDAHILEEVAKMFGYGCVRGSSSKGGRNAVREMLESSKSTHLTITPDGPLGPRRQMAPGAIFLASKTQFPIVLLGVGFERPYRLNSWDKHAIPRPFSRARVLVSDDIEVPAKLSREELERYRLFTENKMTLLTEEAERWATSGEYWPGQSELQIGPKSSVLYFGQAKGCGFPERVYENIRRIER